MREVQIDQIGAGFSRNLYRCISGGLTSNLHQATHVSIHLLRIQVIVTEWALTCDLCLPPEAPLDSLYLLPPFHEMFRQLSIEATFHEFRSDLVWDEEASWEAIPFSSIA